MVLNGGHTFTQASLQDFVDCPRRFQLRYLMELPWPAVPTEPISENEKITQLGQRFHQMAHQRFLGIQSANIEASINDQELQEWWHNFEDFACTLINQKCVLLPEFTFTSSIEQSRIVAKFDLILACSENKFTIYDWKTYRSRPILKNLLRRIQSRVYPYLLTKVGADINRRIAIDPANVEMIYWFASYPEQAIRFSYNSSRFHADERFLTNLIETINGLDENKFFLTEDQQQCKYCVYRSLCDRGATAGEINGMDDFLDTPAAAEIEFDFDQISEIEL
jgi:hypothetical protein